MILTAHQPLFLPYLGHFAKIAEWRDAEALKITQNRRPDLLE